MQGSTIIIHVKKSHQVQLQNFAQRLWTAHRWILWLNVSLLTRTNTCAAKLKLVLILTDCRKETEKNRGRSQSWQKTQKFLLGRGVYIRNLWSLFVIQDWGFVQNASFCHIQFVFNLISTEGQQINKVWFLQTGWVKSAFLQMNLNAYMGVFFVTVNVTYNKSSLIVEGNSTTFAFLQLLL